MAEACREGQVDGSQGPNGAEHEKQKPSSLALFWSLVVLIVLDLVRSRFVYDEGAEEGHDEHGPSEQEDEHAADVVDHSYHNYQRC